MDVLPGNIGRGELGKVMKGFMVASWCGGKCAMVHVWQIQVVEWNSILGGGREAALRGAAAARYCVLGP